MRVILERVQKGAFLADHFQDAYLFENPDLKLLLITVERIALFDANRFATLWQVSATSLVRLE